MPMLARSAQGLYWMGRYLERAAHLCRQLQLQTAALADRSIPEIYAGWNRIYGSLHRQPPGGSLAWFYNGIGGGDDIGGDDIGGGIAPAQSQGGQGQGQGDPGDDYTLADSFALADDLTFERSNPGSVWSCFAQGRENARQMRHCISAEMWTSLNLAYLRIQQVRITDIWTASPESFYAATSADIDTFMGVAAATMYRGEGWHFMQLGRFVERAQQVAAVLLAQTDADMGASVEQSESDWVTLLRAHHAYEEYTRAYGVAARPEPALDLLVTDPLLPNSICRSLDRAELELAALGAAPDAAAAAAVRRLSGRLRAVAHYEWPDRDDRTELLRRIDAHCRELHDLITLTYFEYPVVGAGAPVRLAAC